MLEPTTEPITSGRHRHYADITANGCASCAVELNLLEHVRAWLRDLGPGKSAAQAAEALALAIEVWRTRL